MPPSVILTIVQGSPSGRKYEFQERGTCLIGRSPDCNIPLPSGEAQATVSRHHCLLDVAPPKVRIRDFGSLNGTFVNGENIGSRAGGQAKGKEYDLKPGDTFRVGETVFEVSVTGEEGDDTVAQSCSRCGASMQAGQGDLCAACRDNPLGLVEAILEQARQGKAGFAGIEGYRVRKELGRGGMGAVYLAENQATGGICALKVLLPQAAANKRAVQLFLREAENSKILKHPNVVQVFETGFSGGTFFIAMEYCNDKSLRDLVERSGGKVPVGEAVRLVLLALEGLEYIHTVELPRVKLADGSEVQAVGMVHRDLKPPNIFLHKEGDQRVAKIADVGLSKAFDFAGLSGQTRTGQAAGSPMFMPRQQVIHFKYAKPEVDVWGMAATLYYLITGASPREFTQGRDPWLTVLQTQPTPILLRDPSVPERLAEVIDTALVDYPKLTFTSAAQLRKALEDAL